MDEKLDEITGRRTEETFVPKKYDFLKKTGCIHSVKNCIDKNKILQSDFVVEHCVWCLAREAWLVAGKCQRLQTRMLCLHYQIRSLSKQRSKFLSSNS